MFGMPLVCGYNRSICCVCKYSKLTRLIPVFAGAGELAAPEVAKLFFENVVCLFGVPAMVLHDRDPRFMASFWQSLWTLLGRGLHGSIGQLTETEI